MPTVQDILASKGSHVYRIDASATVLEATHVMNEHKIGALVVMDKGKVTGIFTERDVLRRVVAVEKSPSKVTVGEVMTADMVCCRAEDDLDDVSRVMADRRVRHLPVCGDGGDLLGLISIGDVNMAHASTQEAQITFLSEYVYGRA
jgi:CBS domain-containing protein